MQLNDMFSFYAIFEQPLKCHDWFLLFSLSLARKPHALFLQQHVSAVNNTAAVKAFSGNNT